jgi:uncharacterized protein YcfL
MKIKKIVISAGLLTLAGMLMGGCTTVNTVENAQKEGQKTMISDQRVITDASLARKVAIVGINSAMTSGGLLKIQVEVENHTQSLQRFLYRFEWFDANGMQVSTILSASIPEQIEGGESKFVSSIAPNPNCRDFRIKFIEAD